MDGICSAAIVKKVHPDVECIPCQYGKEPKIDVHKNKNNEVFIVDFSFDEGTMLDLLISSKSVCWIDHHKSARDELFTLWNNKEVKGIRNIEFSACELTWEYFFQDEDTPMAVIHIGDFDMWKFEILHTKSFFETAHIMLDSPYTPTWEKFLGNDYEQILKEYIDIGIYLVKAKTKRFQVSVSNGFDINWHGYKTRVINTNHDISNAGAYAIEKGYDIAIIWYNYRNKIRVGLRSKSDTDVSTIAKQYGGGGHKNAAGFIQSPKEFFEMVNLIK